MIKTLSKIEIEGAFLNVIKAIPERSTATIILSGQKIKAFPLRSAKRQIVHFHHLYSIYSGSLNHSNQTRKGNKRKSKLERTKQNCHCLHMRW